MRHQSRVRPLPHTPLPVETVRVGRWAPNVSYPHHGYLDPEVDIAPIVHETLQQNFTQVYDQEDGAGLNLKGTVLAYGSSKKRDGSSDKVSTDLSRVYQLDNPEKWFDNAIQCQKNRNWIENALKAHGRIYMIIGYQTVDNAHIEGETKRSKESSITLQAPGTAAVAATTGIPLAGDGLDPNVRRERHEHRQSKQSFTSPGQLVVAIQYRRIRFRFFSSGKVDPKHLESKTCWKYVWDMRGHAPDANDIIEASLAYDDMSDEEDEDVEDEDVEDEDVEFDDLSDGTSEDGA